MRAHISLLTLAVDDLDRAVAFYRDGLGLPTDGIVGTEFALGAVAFFKLDAGVKLAVWPRRSLLAETGLADAPRGSPSVAIGHNVASEKEVRAVLAQAVAAGGTLVKPAQPVFWGGYAGYFQDPDGHLWEVAFNPQRPA